MSVPVIRINQGFYGKYSHAGSKKINYTDGSGNYGAIDFKADKDTPAYAVLPGKIVYADSAGDDFHRVTIKTEINGETYYLEYLHFQEIKTKLGEDVKMGTQIGTVGGWGRLKNEHEFLPHLDFRVYQFKDESSADYKTDGTKKFIDPFELFDFDVQFKYNTNSHDYH